MEHNLKHINKLQVPTWTWLAINDTDARLDFTGLKPFDKDPLQNNRENNNGGIRIEKEIRAKALRPEEKASQAAVEMSDFVKKRSNHRCHIIIEDGQIIKEPIMMDFALDKENSLLIDHIMIDAGENSKATIILKYSSEDNNDHNGHSQENTSDMCNNGNTDNADKTEKTEKTGKRITVHGGNNSYIHCGYTQMNLKKGARINLIKVQLLSEDSVHIDATGVNVEEAAEGNILLAELGSKKTVSACDVSLAGKGSRANVDSIYIGNKSKNLDMNYRMEYDGTDTEGYITAKGVLLGSSKKVLKDTLDFIAGSSGSKGREEESVIALSDKAVNICAPLLLCAEDRVDGQHASNIGKLDDNKLFYLMSRGLGEKEAKRLMVEASFAPIIDKIPQEALRDRISGYLTEVIENGE